MEAASLFRTQDRLFLISALGISRSYRQKKFSLTLLFIRNIYSANTYPACTPYLGLCPGMPSVKQNWPGLSPLLGVLGGPSKAGLLEPSQNIQICLIRHSTHWNLLLSTGTWPGRQLPLHVCDKGPKLCKTLMCPWSHYW